ncbi:MAG: ribonuclease E, partial [Myxococcota bacterium]
MSGPPAYSHVLCDSDADVRPEDFMTKRMLIAVDEEESRVAIIDGRRLENLEIEAHGGEGRRGNIYKGVVHKVEQSLQAAFIDFGEEKQGFLPLTEIHRRLWPDSVSDKRPDISSLLKEGQQLMVQVVKDEIGTKGATLTTYVSLPGRYMVLMPESDKSGISRRLSDTERRRLKETIDSIGVPEGFGVIIRTAGQQQRPVELKKDLLYLTKLYESIEEKHGARKKAGLIYKDRRHAVRFIRDYFTEEVEEVWCDNRSVLKEISEFMGVLMPNALQKLRLYESEAPLFIKFGVEDQIESVFARQVLLPGGGSIVIDQTEALVAIDVNSGRVKGQDIEDTALMTNLEAAEEVARQVKIRDLGGLVVIDFIDMRDRKNNRSVEQRLRKAFQEDKSKIKFGRISQFGLMELSRQRLRKSLAASVTRRCDACDGTGQVRAPGSAALSL